LELYSLRMFWTEGVQVDGLELNYAERLTDEVRGKLPNRLTFPFGKLRLVPCFARNANECIAEKSK
jgi:hypothetical protein